MIYNLPFQKYFLSNLDPGDNILKYNISSNSNNSSKPYTHGKILRISTNFPFNIITSVGLFTIKELIEEVIYKRVKIRKKDNVSLLDINDIINNYRKHT